MRTPGAALADFKTTALDPFKILGYDILVSLHEGEFVDASLGAAGGILHGADVIDVAARASRVEKSTPALLKRIPLLGHALPVGQFGYDQIVGISDWVEGGSEVLRQEIARGEEEAYRRQLNGMLDEAQRVMLDCFEKYGVLGM